MAAGQEQRRSGRPSSSRRRRPGRRRARRHGAAASSAASSSVNALGRAQAAPVAAVVDADEGVALGQRLVGGEELQVARRRPAVQQQHDGRRRIGVAVDADEQLAAPVDAHQATLREPRQAQLVTSATYRAYDCARLRSPTVTRRRRPARSRDRAAGVVAPAAGHDAAGPRPRPASTPPAIRATGRRGEVLATEPLAAPTGARGVAGPLPHARRRRAGRSPRRWPSPRRPASAPRPRPVVVWVHGAGRRRPRVRAVADRASRPGTPTTCCADGAVVVAPDLTGLGIEGVTHPYLHGTTAGRSVLDAARAAADLTATGAGGVVGLAGHSAGGHAVLWANELAAGDDGAGLDVRLAVPMSPIGDLAVAMDPLRARRRPWPPSPSSWRRRGPASSRSRPADVLTPAAIGPPRPPRTDRLAAADHTSSPATRRAGCAPTGSPSPAWAAALERQSAGTRRAPRPCCSSTATPTTPSASSGLAPGRPSMAARRRRRRAAHLPGADHMGVARRRPSGRRRGASSRRLARR